MTSLRVREHRETTFLGVIEALVERIGSIGDFLQPGSGGGKIVRALLQPCDGIEFFSAVLSRAIAMLPVSPARLALGATRFGVIDPLLGKITYRALDCWPVLFLIRRQLQARFHGRDPRICERQPVLDGEARMLPFEMTMLRVDRTGTDDCKTDNSGDNGFLHRGSP